MVKNIHNFFTPIVYTEATPSIKNREKNQSQVNKQENKEEKKTINIFLFYFIFFYRDLLFSRSVKCLVEIGII